MQAIPQGRFVGAGWSAVIQNLKVWVRRSLDRLRPTIPTLPPRKVPASQGSNVALRKWSLLPPCFNSMMCQGLVCRDSNRRLVAPRQSLQLVTPLWPGNIETFYPVFVLLWIVPWNLERNHGMQLNNVMWVQGGFCEEKGRTYTWGSWRIEILADYTIMVKPLKSNHQVNWWGTYKAFSG